LTGKEEEMPLTIGEVAKAADVNIETIRYYERRGLFPAPPRTRSGYRQYTNETVRRLRFVKRAQGLGFTLTEIEELLALRVRHDAACGPVERRVRQKLAVVERKIEEMRRLRRALSRLADACAERKATDDCPILEALEDHAFAEQ
jgi:Hg(II)-responsive transcriptional regulator